MRLFYVPPTVPGSTTFAGGCGLPALLLSLGILLTTFSRV